MSRQASSSAGHLEKGGIRESAVASHSLRIAGREFAVHCAGRVQPILKRKQAQARPACSVGTMAPRADAGSAKVLLLMPWMSPAARPLDDEEEDGGAVGGRAGRGADMGRCAPPLPPPWWCRPAPAGPSGPPCVYTLLAASADDVPSPPTTPGERAAGPSRGARDTLLLRATPPPPPSAPAPARAPAAAADSAPDDAEVERRWLMAARAVGPSAPAAAAPPLARWACWGAGEDAADGSAPLRLCGCELEGLHTMRWLMSASMRATCTCTCARTHASSHVELHTTQRASRGHGTRPHPAGAHTNPLTSSS